ncbi:MAG: hypothetical protein ACFCU5_10615 [Pleurocapsa sp.]
MASDRQKRIREHLAKSSGGGIDFQLLPRNYKHYNPDYNFPMSFRSQVSHLEHIERSKGNYNLNSGNKQARKSRILEHIRLTKG